MNTNTLNMINTIITTAVTAGNLEMAIADPGYDEEYGMYGITHTFYTETDEKISVEIGLTPDEEGWIHSVRVGESHTRSELKSVRQLKNLLYPQIHAGSEMREVAEYFQNI